VRFAAALVLLTGLVAGCAADAVPDTQPVVLGTTGPPGEAWELVGARRGGRLCATLRRTGEALSERCGEEATSIRTWEVSTTAYESRVVVFAPLPTRAIHVRLDGLDGSITVVDARTAPGFPGRFLLTEVDANATPKSVRVFGIHGRAVVPAA
jgi:hypothetical protein